MLPISDFKINKQKEKNYNLVGKIKVKLVVAISIMVIGLFFVQLVFANNLAVDGQKLSQIEEEINKIGAENTTLKVKIAEESSLVALSKKAKKIGFEKPSKIIGVN